MVDSLAPPTVDVTTAVNPVRKRPRKGEAVLDYVLVMGVALPMTVFVLYVGPRIMNLVYELTCALVAWPFS